MSTVKCRGRLEIDSIVILKGENVGREKTRIVLREMKVSTASVNHLLC